MFCEGPDVYSIELDTYKISFETITFADARHKIAECGQALLTPWKNTVCYIVSGLVEMQFSKPNWPHAMYMIIGHTHSDPSSHSGYQR